MPHTTPSPGITADALLRRELQEPVWVVPGLLPAGLAICAGQPKTGKSFLSLHLALSVASGRPFLGAFPVKRGAVLYLALEDDLRRLQSRLTLLLRTEKAPRRLHFHLDWPTSQDGALDRIDTWVDAHSGSKLVIIDTLARLRGPDPASRTGYRAEYAELAAMKKLADAKGVGLLLVHHLTKSKNRDPFAQFSGSIGLTAAADTLLHLDRRRATEECLLRTTGRDVEERELGLSFVHGRYQLDGEGPEVSLSPERRAILDFVRRAHGPVAPHVVSSGLGLHPGGTRKLMVLMREQGVLVRVDCGYTATMSTPPPAQPTNVLPFPDKRQTAPPKQ